MKKPLYFLINHWNSYYLYLKEGKSIILLQEEARWEPILETLGKKRVSTLSVLDFTAQQNIKIEKTSRHLNLFEYWQWYWQKRRLAQQQFSFGLVKMRYRNQSVIIAGLNETANFIQIKDKLKSSSITSSFFSYPLALLHLLYKNLEQLVSPSLVIAIDRFSHLTFGFFSHKELLFIRLCHATTQQSGDQYIKNTVLDTLKYLEKSFTPEKIALIFCSEAKDFSGQELLSFFSQASFFHGESLIDLLKLPFSPDSEGIFDRALILTSFGTSYCLSPQPGPSLKEKLFSLSSQGIKLSSLFLVMGTFYLSYKSFFLHRKNNEIKQHLQSLNQKLIKLEGNISALPFSFEQVDQILSISQKAMQQQKKMWQFIDLLSYILDQRCTVQFLSFGPQKVRLSLQPLHKDASVEDFLELWHQTLLDFPVIHPPDFTLSWLTLQVTSPFFLSP